MRFGRSACTVFAAALLCSGTGSVYAAGSEVLAPGYRPALDTEEGGLWSLMDRQEAELKVSPALVTDAALNTYVKKIVCELAGDQCASLRVYIVDDPNSNAMTAPNGMVIVWTGLLLRSQNEAELAFVLGHEIMHYLKRHSLLNFQKMTHTAGTLVALSATGLGGLLELAAAGMLASYSRDQEREADAGGFDLVVSKGYDARHGAVFMANTAEEEDANPNRTKSSAYRSSHPDMKERFAVLTKRGTVTGFRFDLAFTTEEGLQMKGMALFAQRRKKLDVILFVAPSEYYYDEYAPTVEKIFASVRVPDAPAAKPAS